MNNEIHAALKCSDRKEGEKEGLDDDMALSGT
jgi:hypothetical protein